ncbi:MAG: Gfo/Idh/MocA family protein [Lachnospirales bacterium]
MSIAIVTESQDIEMREVKVGIIGCGGIANGKHMPSLHKLPNVKIVAFCDLILERAEKAKEEYGTDDALVCTDYKELVSVLDIEIVHVLTPNSSHAELSIAALNSGKHVMCEKPMASTYKDAEAMCVAAKKNNKFLTVGYQTRSTTTFQYARKLIEDGELGEIYYVKSPAMRRRGAPLWGVFLDKEKQGGGPMIDIGTHSIDAALYLMNNYEVESVFGSIYRKLADTAMYSNEWGIWEPEDFIVEDSAFAHIKFKNGALMIVETAWLINMEEGDCTTLCGTKGGIKMKGDAVYINGEKNNALYINEVKPNSTNRTLFKGQDLTAEEYEAKQWIYSVINNIPPLTKPEEACVVSRIIEAVYKSAEIGKPIYFD